MSTDREMSGEYGDQFSESTRVFEVAEGSKREDHYIVTISFKVQVFDPSNRFLAKWGTEGSAVGEFYLAAGIALDGAAKVYMTYGLNNQVSVYAPSQS